MRKDMDILCTPVLKPFVHYFHPILHAKGKHEVNLFNRAKGICHPYSFFKNIFFMRNLNQYSRPGYLISLPKEYIRPLSNLPMILRKPFIHAYFVSCYLV
jgi:hypothetical protein